MHKYDIILYASNQEKREKGLMFSDPLGDNECALFVFPRTADHSFWNKNVSYPLDLIFCDMNNEVVDIKKMDAESTSPCRSGNSNIKYVVEAKGHSTKDINIGDILVIENNGDQLYFSNK